MRESLLSMTVVAMLLLGACSTQTSAPPAGEPQELEGGKLAKYSPASISTFASATEGEALRFFLLLEDADGGNTPADGQVTIEILDELDNSLYYDKFYVTVSEFIDYEFKLTGQHIGKAYDWTVPVTAIQTGISSVGLGRAVLTFEAPGGQKLHAEYALVRIPTYSGEELKLMAEEQYGKSIIIVDQKLSKGSFEVTVTKTGFFNPYGQEGKKEYLRIDMEVKNTGDKDERFSPSGTIVLDDQGDQYQGAYGGELDIHSDIQPGVTKKGYALFKDVPATAISVRLMFQLGYDAKSHPSVFEYTIQLKQ